MSFSEWYGASAATGYLYTLSNPTPATSDLYSSSLTLTPTYAVISAREAEASPSRRGVVYVYNRSTGSLLYTLDNPNLSGIYFGTSLFIDYTGMVSANDTYLLVGSFAENSGGGVVYVFNISNGQLLRTINNPNYFSTEDGDNFGLFTTIYGDMALISAINEDYGAYPDTDAGIAYLFDVTTGQLLHTLINPNLTGDYYRDRFGTAVALNSTYAVVSSRNDGNISVFSTSTGQLLRTITAPEGLTAGAADRFGWDVAIDEGTNIVVSATYDNYAGTAPYASGRAFLFNASTGSLIRTIDNPALGERDFFGTSVDISGDRIAISAPKIPGDGGGSTLGTVQTIYVFSLSTGNILHTFTSDPNDPTVRKLSFGTKISLEGNRLLISTPLQTVNTNIYNAGEAVMFGV